MSKSIKPLRAVFFIGAGIVLILFVGALVKYEVLANTILHWIDQLKPGK